jgi:hypothetical protein
MARTSHSKTITLLMSGAMLAVTTGCTEFWTSTVSRNRPVHSGDVLMTTADLRQTTRQLMPGGVITCAEPSPDVAKIAAAAMDASASGSASSAGDAVSPALAASLATSRSEALAQLGQRIATVQLLRDGMFRACEAFSNGAIDKSAYSAILSRYDKLMITMLLGEFAANSTTRIIPVTLTGNSEAHGNADATAGVPATPGDTGTGGAGTGGAGTAGGGASSGTGGTATPTPTTSGGTAGTGGTAGAESEAKSATQAPTIMVLQEGSDRPAIAAALATMQQAYIDDLNVDPLMLNCMRTDLTPSSLALCQQIASESQVFPKLVDAKVLSVLMRAKAENDTVPMEDTVQKIKELEAELAKLRSQTKPVVQ